MRSLWLERMLYVGVCVPIQEVLADTGNLKTTTSIWSSVKLRPIAGGPDLGFPGFLVRIRFDNVEVKYKKKDLN